MRRAFWIWIFLANCRDETLWWTSTLPFSTNMINIHHEPPVEHIPFLVWCHVTHVFRRKPTVACDLLQVELMHCMSFSYTQVKAIPMLMTKLFVACAYCLRPPWFTIVVTTVLVIVVVAATAAIIIIGSIILSIFIGMFDSQSLSRYVFFNDSFTSMEPRGRRFETSTATRSGVSLSTRGRKPLLKDNSSITDPISIIPIRLFNCVPINIVIILSSPSATCCPSSTWLCFESTLVTTTMGKPSPISLLSHTVPA